jgi:hypothetical protein
MVNTKQKENQSLQDYTKQFKTACDVMNAHVGDPLILTKFIEDMDNNTILEAKNFSGKGV